MDDTQFDTLATQTLARLEQAFEACGADLDFELMLGGILEIEFSNASKIIVNRHAAAREIWVAARSGGFHFRWDGERWRDTRDDEELWVKLERLASEQAGEAVVLEGAFSR